MLSIMPTSIQDPLQKKARRYTLQSILCLPPPPAWMTAAKNVSDDDSSSFSSSEVETSTTVPANKVKEARSEEGVPVPVPTKHPHHPRPINASGIITLQASRCKHSYPVASHSRAHQAFTYRGYDAPLCPHCAIAAPSSASLPLSSSPSFASTKPLVVVGGGGGGGQAQEERARGAATVMATRCGHSITVRRRTAAIIAANPLIFSCPSSTPSPGNSDNNNNNNNKNGEEETANDDKDQQKATEPWPGFTRSSDPSSLALPHCQRKPIRANLNVERCVECVEKEYARSRNELARARTEVSKVGEDNELMEEAGCGFRDLEWEDAASAWLGMWRRRCVELRCGLEVLVAEGERAVKEETGEDGVVDGEGSRVDWGAGFGKRRGSVGSLRSVRSARSVRGLSRSMSMSWAKAKREKNGAAGAAAAALKPALKMSTMADGGEGEGANTKKKKVSGVRFDPNSTNFDGSSRHLAMMERKNMHYHPGRWARDGLLDTSGFSLTTEKQIRDWHFPPPKFSVSPEKDEKGEKRREVVKRFIARTWWF